MPEWFPPLLDRALFKAGSISALSRAIACSRQSIMGWRQESSIPAINYYDAILRYVGGDVYRGMPEWDRPSHTGAPRALVHGQIEAGKVSELGNSRYHIQVIEAAWKQSKWWMRTRGTPAYLEVAGSSMEPVYRAGDIIATRLPASDNVHDYIGAHCIIRYYEEATFKVLRIAEKETILGQPLNPDHKFLTFRDQGNLHIDGVVVGHIPAALAAVLRDPDVFD